MANDTRTRSRNCIEWSVPVRTSVFYLLGALALASCSSSHGPDVGGVPGGRPMVELSEAEWVALCNWREALREDSLTFYYCDPSGNVMPGPGGPEDAGYNWRAASCLGSPRFGYPAAGPECLTTVQEWADCEIELEGLECWRAAPYPEVCLNAYNRCVGEP